MATGTPHSAKSSKKHSLIRSAKNLKTGKYKKQRDRTTANKARRVARQLNLANRPDSTVSDNCLKKRQERRRNNTPAKRRAATKRGETFQQNRDRRGVMLGTPTTEGE